MMAQRSDSFFYAATSSDLTRLIEACKAHNLTSWEAEFINSVCGRRRPPTEKQLMTLRRIASGGLNYKVIAAAAIRVLPEILSRWLPGGQFVGCEYVVINPKRTDRSAGSFAVNITTGKWADFATGDRGGDAIALAAWLFSLPQPEAARQVAVMLNINIEDQANG